MEIVKDIFFFIGSMLGIFAFIRNLIEPAFKTNREKWEKIKKKLQEDDFSDLQYEIYVRRRIQISLLQKIYSFVCDIEKDAEYLRMGPPFRRKFEKHKKNISDLHYNLRDYIQVPYWEPKPDNEYNELAREWIFNKSYFLYEVDDGHEEYVTHLEKASDIVDEMRRQYRAISYLANLHIFEALVAKFIIKKRAKLPKK